MSTSAETAVAETSKTAMVPLAESSHNRGTWKPVEVAADVLNVRGGFNTKNEVASSIRYQTGTTTCRFVELDKTPRGS